MTTKPQPSEKQPKADDRNIVALDSSYEGASFEDRVFLFWHNYQKIILGVCVVAVLALVGWGLIAFMDQRREAQIAAEYQEAISMDEITAFAERNAPHSLAGAAFLEVADYHFANSEYSEAASFYGRAAAILPPVLSGRAKIGQGVSLAHAGEQDAALAHFEQVGADQANFAVTRAEAFYYAAAIAIELDQEETARDHIARVIELDESQMWASRALGLEQALPELPEETESAE